jgi:hypothetical protein
MSVEYKLTKPNERPKHGNPDVRPVMSLMREKHGCYLADIIFQKDVGV